MREQVSENAEIIHLSQNTTKKSIIIYKLAECWSEWRMCSIFNYFNTNFIFYIILNLYYAYVYYIINIDI
mgnify:CR=1 FL=1